MIVAAIVIVLLVVIALFGTFFTVQTKSVAVIQRLGKFQRMATAGLNVKIPLIDKVSNRLSLRVQALNETVDTKTKDNVTVSVGISVQYYVDPENVFAAAYKLTNAESQISDYLFDAVRAVVPSLTLDEAFENKDRIATEVGNDIAQSMLAYGYIIEKTLIVDIEMDAQVRTAMNDINAAERLAVAAKYRAEAKKVELIGIAEGEAAAKKLSGEGVADQRKAIARGLKEQFEMLTDAGVKNADEILMMNQYFDTLQQVAKDGSANTVFLPGSPSGVSDLSQQIRNSILTAEAAKRDL